MDASPGPVPVPPPAIDVAAGLLFHRGRLLIAQRPAHTHLAGLWEFPGGKLEPGESWAEGLVRELREELDVEVEVGVLVDEITHAYPGKTVRLRFHRCRLLAGTPRPVGCAAVAWVTSDELGRYDFPPADARLLRLLADRRDLWAD